jgi:hypothetical protein
MHAVTQREPAEEGAKGVEGLEDWKRGRGAAGVVVVDGGGAEGVDWRRGEETTEHWRSEERQGGEGD